MPVDQRIQQKIGQLTSNASIDNKTKLAVRKRSYELKKEEVDLEALMDTFNDSVGIYEQQIDKILSDVVGVVPGMVDAPVVVPEAPAEEVPVEARPAERIIVPTNQRPAGVKVRMQEELEDENTEVEEVPYELSQE